MDDYEDMPWTKGDWLVFWAMTAFCLLLVLFAILRDEQNTGKLGQSCLPDGSCKSDRLVCREVRERGDWRCALPREVVP